MITNENDDKKSPVQAYPSIEDRLMKDRIVWLKEEVNGKSANDVVNRLMLLHSEDPDKDIFFLINSPGGSITSGMSIYDEIQFISNDVVTIGTGMCASMGQFLLSSGTPGKRFLLPNARVLMHQPSSGYEGLESDIRIQSGLINDMKAVMADLTAKQTGQTVETILKDNEYDHWYNAKQALDYGFIDHIVGTENEMREKLENFTPGYAWEKTRKPAKKTRAKKENK